jgi:RimJ/RimL family protein N-acetyltransferase
VTDAPTTAPTDPPAGPPPTGSAEPLLHLRVMDEALLAAVAALAVAEAEPSEVMPVPPGTRRWTPELSRAFVDHHRGRLPGLEGDHREVCFVVMEAGNPVGVARLAHAGEETFEAGCWLARSARSSGIGTGVLATLLTEARRRAVTVVATTTATNVAAVTLLRRSGADLRWEDDGTVAARLS